MIEIIAIGDEVLYGYSVNSNASFISQQLIEHGFKPVQHIVVGDNPANLKKVLYDALERGSYVITTGGLGPTCDDWTRKVVAEIFNVPLVEPHGLREKLITLFGPPVSILEDQLLQPQGAHLFENRLGTASGFYLKDLIALPGVPQEMKEMFVQKVLPFLKEIYKPAARTFTEAFHFFLLKESEVDPVLRIIEKKFPDVLCGIYPGYSQITVHLSCEAKSQSEADASIKPAKEILLSNCQKYLFISASGQLKEAVHQALIDSNITLATAESCTGGALAASLVSQPDASKYFQGSIVAYTNEMKEKLLYVDPKTVAKHGVVSEEVTIQMAQNVRTVFHAACGIGVSGILGPTGGTVQKPVGTVCMSISLQDRPNYSKSFHFVGNRAANLERAVQAILAELFLQLQKK